jgi:hypothetical protein
LSLFIPHIFFKIALAISVVLRNQRFSSIYESLCKLLLKPAIFWRKKTHSALAKAGRPL